MDASSELRRSTRNKKNKRQQKEIIEINDESSDEESEQIVVDHILSEVGLRIKSQTILLGVMLAIKAN